VEVRGVIKVTVDSEYDTEGLGKDFVSTASGIFVKESPANDYLKDHVRMQVRSFDNHGKVTDVSKVRTMAGFIEAIGCASATDCFALYGVELSLADGGICVKNDDHVSDYLRDHRGKQIMTISQKKRERKRDKAVAVVTEAHCCGCFPANNKVGDVLTSLVSHKDNTGVFSGTDLSTKLQICPYDPNKTCGIPHELKDVTDDFFRPSLDFAEITSIIYDHSDDTNTVGEI